MGFSVSQKITGKIVRWHDDKGFGFIQSDSQQELFFHISDYRANVRPSLTENVVFELGTDKRGKPCAKNIQQASFVQQKLKQQNSRTESQRQALQVNQSNELEINFTLMFGIVFFVLLAGITFAKALPLWILGWYMAINLTTFLLYAHDKNSAQNNSWRVQEASLHKLALLGGWVGAGVAHKTLRHKSQKTEFRQGFYLTIVGNLVLLGVLWYFNLRMH